MNRRLLAVGIAAAALLVAGATTWAHMEPTEGRLLPYEGYLDLDGKPVTETYDFRFALVTSNDPTLVTCLTTTCGASSATFWWDEYDGLAVNNGAFSAVLGSGSTAITNALLGNTDLYLGIAVRQAGSASFTGLQNLQRVLSVPFAARAAAAKNFKVTGNLTVDGTTTLGTTTIGGHVTGNVALDNKLVLNATSSTQLTTLKGLLVSNEYVYDVTQNAGVATWGYSYTDHMTPFATSICFLTRYRYQAVRNLLNDNFDNVAEEYKCSVEKNTTSGTWDLNVNLGYGYNQDGHGITCAARCLSWDW